MTSHDQAFFTMDGDDLVPSPIARGPWGSTISGNYVGGLLGRAVERTGGDPGLQPARLTVDLLRPAALEPLRVETSVERDGRRLRLVDAVMIQNGRLVARAAALFLRRGEQPEDPVWTSPIEMPPLPSRPVDITGDFTMELWAYGGNSATNGPSMDLSEWSGGGPKFAWVRDVKPLVDGEAVTPFVRAAMAGDVTSSLTHSSATGSELHQRRLHADAQPVARRRVRRSRRPHALQQCRGGHRDGGAFRPSRADREQRGDGTG